MKAAPPCSQGRTILVAHPVPGLYGADRMMLAAMRLLADGGDRVTVFVPETGPLLPLLEQNGIAAKLFAFPVLRKCLLRPSGLLRLGMMTPWHVFRLWQLIRRADPDLIYVNTITLPHWLLAARLARVPAVCHVREAEHGMSRRKAGLLLAPVRFSAVVIANSEATARWVTKHQPVLTDQVRVVHNGFAFAPVQLEARADRGRLVVVGRLSPRKGQDLALLAVAQLVNEGREVELHLVGDTFRGYEWYEEQLRADIVRLGLTGHAFVDGFRADPTSSYVSAGMVLVPSRLEPFGNVAVEAMAVGRPVIAARIGGLPEIIDDEQTGLLIPPDDAPALATAIARLLDDADLARRLATAGAAAVRQRFGMERFGADLREAVASAVAQPVAVPIAGNP